MAHSIYSATGGANALSASVAVASGAHVYALVNQATSAARITVSLDTDGTFEPEYTVGTQPVAVGSEHVVSNGNNALTYNLPAGGVALFEVTLASGVSGEFSLTGVQTAHGTQANDHQRIWLAQV